MTKYYLLELNDDYKLGFNSQLTKQEIINIGIHNDKICNTENTPMEENYTFEYIEKINAYKIIKVV